MHLPARKRNENTKIKDQLGQDDIPKLASLPGERECCKRDCFLKYFLFVNILKYYFFMF
jgi:hypothetical protein